MLKRVYCKLCSQRLEPPGFLRIFCARRGQSVKVADTPHANPVNNNSLPRIIESADRAYATRQTIQNIHESVRMLRNALKQSGDYEIAWRLSRVLFFLGQESETETTGSSSRA